MGLLKDGSQKPHAVCIPYPAQGHLNPMLQLAKLLHAKGFHITFVNTEYNHNRLVRSHGAAAVAGRPSFGFETIPDGLPVMNEIDSTQDLPSLCASTERNCLVPFNEILARLNEADNKPLVSCVISDALMFFTIDAAQELGVPAVLFWTASACGLLGCAQFQKLVDLGVVPFKDSNFFTNGGLDLVIDWIPGMKNIRLHDLPSFIRTTDSNDFMLNYVLRLIHSAKRADAILFNSFVTLENDVFQSLSSDFPPLYSLGPLQLLLETVEFNDKETKSISTSLWKEDSQCLDWLDSCEPNSVVYVNFGSITVMTNDQFVEFAWGLANANLPFLWITRPDLIIGDAAVLPPEFLEVTKKRGLITSWCNQAQVLEHPAIGGFLTHCGWNSVMESLINGVPILCWPFFAEQQTNCWFSCNKWGVGMEINVNVKRSEVEKQVMELMKGDKRKKMMRKAKEWRRLAYEAVATPNGSSHDGLDKVIKMLVSSN